MRNIMFRFVVVLAVFRFVVVLAVTIVAEELKGKRIWLFIISTRSKSSYISRKLNDKCLSSIHYHKIKPANVPPKE
jgi:hypothetical protein